MKDSINFRALNDFEAGMLKKGLIEISPKGIKFFENNINYFYVKLKSDVEHKSLPMIFFVSEETKNLIDRIKNKGKIESGGIYFGFLKKGKFYLSLEGAEYLYKNRIFPESQTVFVNDKGEKSILYGNDLKKRMAKRYSEKLSKGDSILILNKLGEVCALGLTKLNGYAIKKKSEDDESPIALTLIDKGYYLRKLQF